jgi:lysyl-tRNA synthetase class 2
MDLEMLKERARIIRQVRSFFDNKNYLELDTPLLSPNLIPESCLEVFETRRILPGRAADKAGSTPYWLIPSPEIWMKKIIAQHHTNVYQICKCFRNGESSGFLHSPEFTMLEYYTMGIGYIESLELTEDLFGFLVSRDRGSGIGDRGSGRMGELSRLHPPFERLTVAEAFDRFAGFDLFVAAETAEGMETEARRLGLNPMPGIEVAGLYDLIFIHAVEPQLKMKKPIALLDYPAFVPCLARRNADGKTVERWELYYNGIELANCFSEETDVQRIQDFFNREAMAKEQNALVKHSVDKDYWKIFTQTETNSTENSKTKTCSNGQGHHPFSGVALGLDRLIMALSGRSSIDSVLPFPME